MTTKIKTILTVVLPALCLYALSLWNLCKPAEEFSVSERRKLAQFPEVTVYSVLSGDFMEDFASYAADQFPRRDDFRKLKTLAAVSVFGQLDNHGIYAADGHIAYMEYPLNLESLTYAAKRFRYLYETYMQDTNVRIYGAIIPDKNYFLAAESGRLALDYHTLYTRLSRETDFISYIDLRGLLDLEDYYYTDPHWRQEQIVDVAKQIAAEMGIILGGDYERQVLDVPFYGAYYGQAALSLPADELVYLTNDVLRRCRVYNYETEQEMSVYDMEKAYGKDPYEMFLSGSVSVLTIENPAIQNGRELVVFRDSFASSLVPLLAEGYEKITLIDIRYIPGERLEKLLKFEDQDVLFLYSTLVLNNSGTLK